MEKPSTNLQIALSSLIATLFSLGLAVAIGLAKMHSMPAMMVSVGGTLVTVGLFSLPLLWWRRKAGYAGAIVIGAVNILGNIGAIASGLPGSEGVPIEYLAIVISQTIASVLLVVYTVKVWKEPA